MSLEIALADDCFSDWQSLLSLLQEAFAYMDDRIDPPSSLHLMTLESVAAKVQDESLFLASEGGELIGCVFATSQNDSLYVGKLAVHPDHQRRGIGRRLMEGVEQHALEKGMSNLALKVRIELIENHSVFESLGFFVTGEHSHAGYDRPTFYSMRKEITSLQNQ